MKVSTVNEELGCVRWELNPSSARILFNFSFKNFIFMEIMLCLSEF